jgi:acyl-CoA reductase-like NAD-dependent aldehyde dehydrogenase
MNYRMYLDGQWVDARNGGSWQVIDPATEEVHGHQVRLARNLELRHTSKRKSNKQWLLRV